MVESALFHENILRDLDFDNFKISVKTSNVLLTVESYKELSKATDAPLHLGITEAGGLMDGTIKSSIGIGQLLTQGIGDTLRVSLSADPVEEVKVGFSILKSLGIRQKGINIISCPSCARQGLTDKYSCEIRKTSSHVSEPFTISIIGCVVNGPGEATMSDVGFTGGGNESGMLYVDGKQLAKKDNDELIDSIVSEVEKKIKKNNFIIGLNMAQIPLDKLENILIRSAELEKSLRRELSSEEYVKLSKAYSELEPLKKAINVFKNFLSETDELNEIISDTSSDEEMVNLAKNEFEELKEKIIGVEESIQLMLLPKDKADSNDVILEIRAGTGGDEAAIFAGDLYRMYQRYSDLNQWKTQIMALSDGDVGGYKEIIISISGENVFQN